MKLIETPQPTLLRARFATVLENLPSVPSVVLPYRAWSRAARLSYFKALFLRVFRHWWLISFKLPMDLDACLVVSLKLTYGRPERRGYDKFRQVKYDKICGVHRSGCVTRQEVRSG